LLVTTWHDWVLAAASSPTVRGVES
jgi:hypothetical protein